MVFLVEKIPMAPGKRTASYGPKTSFLKQFAGYLRRQADGNLQALVLAHEKNERYGSNLTSTAGHPCSGH